MEWTKKEVQLLGRNQTELVNDALNCRTMPSSSDLAEFRTQPDKFVALMRWLSLGTKQDAILLNKFQYVPGVDNAGVVEDKTTLHEVRINWTERRLTLVTANKFDEYTIRKIPARDFAAVWMAYEKQAKYPDNESALIWITDWKSGKMYQKDAYVSDAYACGELSTVADTIARFNDASDALNWAEARTIYDATLWESLGDFNPII